MLGKTGLSVSALGFGASSVGSQFRPVPEDEGIRAVHAALEEGINYIDVSPYYGLTKAETILGKAIRDIPRDSFYLSTKAGRLDVDRFDYTETGLIRSVEDSLKRLHTDYVDLLFLHDMEFVPYEQVIGEGVPALFKLKEQGKARFVGVSGLPLTIFERTLRDADLDVILSYCHYTLNDTTLLKLLPLVRRKGIGLVNASPLGMGLLTGKALAAWHPASEEMRAVCRRAAEHCARKGAELARLALQFSVAHPDIPTTLVSTGSAETIRRNVRWIEEPMDEALLAEVLAMLAPIRDKTWPSGLEEYQTEVGA
jgi:aryl-alcohol dehydrogenase-like predicted oxidoreductase